MANISNDTLNGGRLSIDTIKSGGSSRETETVKIYEASEYSPLDAIKAFMGSLDEATSSNVTTMLNNAVTACCPIYSGIQDAINHFLEEAQEYRSSFLSERCGIILGNNDTGAITGSDAGNETTKTAASVVPESGSLNTSFTANSFSKNGLTVSLSSSYSSLTDVQKLIWQALYTWWVEQPLELIKESYGNNYSFDDTTSSATVKSISVNFYNTSNSTLAYVQYSYDTSNGKATNLSLNINMKYYGSLDTTDFDENGESSNASAGYLDRTLAHEFTHAIMAASINYFGNLPMFIKEGMAELTHGIDDERTSTITTLGNGSTSSISRLKAAVNVSNIKTSHNTDEYAGGYMFLRWLAQRAADDSTSNNKLGTKTKDTINNETDSINILALAGNDSITNSGNYVYINGGLGNDTINNSGNYDTLDGGAGNDRLINTGSDCTLYGGAGNDTLTGAAGVSDVFQYTSGDGADIITNYEQFSDIIMITYGAVTASALKGNNVILKVGSGSMTLNDAKGKFIITYDQKTSTPMAAIYGNNSATIKGDGFQLSDGSRLVDETLVGLGGNDSINGLTGDDYLVGNAGNDTLIGDAGEDTLEGGAGNDILEGGADTDKLYGNAGNDTLKGGDGIDILEGGAGNDNLTGGAGSDAFRYTTGDGSDTITDYTFGDDEVDYIKLDGSNTTLSAAALDKNNNVVLTVGKGKLTLSKGDFEGIVIYDNDYNQTLLMVDTESRLVYSYIQSAADSITGSVINDYVFATGTNQTINAGKGADTVNIYSTEGAVYQYANGDGNDLIGFNDYNNLLIDVTSGAVSSVTQKNGSSIIKVGSGTITLNGYTDDVIVRTLNKKKEEVYTRYIGGKAYNDLTFAAESLTGSVAADYIYNASGSLTIDGGAGNDYIRNIGDNVAIGGGAGNDYVYNAGSNVSIVGDAGNDTIHTEAVNTTIDAGAGNDSIKVDSSNNTLIGGAGVDTVNLSGTGNLIQYTAGDGNDVIVNYTSDNTIYLATTDTSVLSSKLNINEKKGINDLILTVGNSKKKGTLTFKDVTDIPIIIKNADGTVSSQVYGATEITVTNADGNLVNAAADMAVFKIDASSRTTGTNIAANKKNNTIYGGAGNDTIATGAGKDLYIYQGGSDIITDYATGQDTIQLNGVTISNAEYVDSLGAVSSTDTNLKFTFSNNGTLLIKNAAKMVKGKHVANKITITDADGITSAQVYGEGDASTIAVVNADGTTIKANADVDYINGKSRSTPVYLIGNTNNNTIVAGTKADTSMEVTMKKPPVELAELTVKFSTWFIFFSRYQ